MQAQATAAGCDAKVTFRVTSRTATAWECGVAAMRRCRRMGGVPARWSSCSFRAAGSRPCTTRRRCPAGWLHMQPQCCMQHALRVAEGCCKPVQMIRQLTSGLQDAALVMAVAGRQALSSGQVQDSRKNLSSGMSLMQQGARSRLKRSSGSPAQPAHIQLNNKGLCDSVLQGAA